jgi:hypothetical protein
MNVDHTCKQNMRKNAYTLLRKGAGKMRRFRRGAA